MALALLNGPTLWSRITNRIHSSGKVRAAIAYVGKGSAKLLPLKRGDVLVVDVSLKAAAQGVTDPREIAKLVKRGVQVFNRSNLHAKVVVTDSYVIVGSANASTNSASVLDEASVESTDRDLRRITVRYVESLCTEPVRPRYLRKCIKAYRPPKFKAAATPTATAGKNSQRPAKLWILGGLRYWDLPESETKSAEAAEKQAMRLRKHTDTEIDQVHFQKRPALAAKLRLGDWAIVCLRHEDGIDVWPPQQFLSVASYPRGQGRRRWLLQFEAPSDGQPLKLPAFARIAARALGVPAKVVARTRPVRDIGAADALMRLWTTRGRVSKATH